MRAKATLIVVMLLAAGSTYGQVPTRTLPVTPLEGLATQPGARTMWSKFIGRLDGRSDSAIVTALAVTTDATAPRLMRGVRIELRHEGARPSCDHKHVEWAVMCARENAAVYIEEDRIEAVRAAMLGGSAQGSRSRGVTSTCSARSAMCRCFLRRHGWCASRACALRV